MIFDKVKEIIVENLGCEEEDVKLESTLIGDLGADSLDIVEMSMSIEDEFNVKIKDEDFENIKTVKDIIDYIEKNNGWEINFFKGYL